MNTYNFVHQLYLNKAGKTKTEKPRKQSFSIENSKMPSIKFDD
jgi:hypothetical protein